MRLIVSTGTCDDDGQRPIIAAEKATKYSGDWKSLLEARWYLMNILIGYLDYSSDVAETVAYSSINGLNRFARVKDGMFVLVRYES